MKKDQTKKKPGSGNNKKSSYEIIELPVETEAMTKFLWENRTKINNQLIDNIGHAISRRMSTVEVFCFKGSNYVVLINRNDFRENLQNVLEFSLKREEFELCGKATQLINKLDKLSHIFSFKKTNKHVKEKTSKE